MVIKGQELLELKDRIQDGVDYNIEVCKIFGNEIYYFKVDEVIKDKIITKRIFTKVVDVNSEYKFNINRLLFELEKVKYKTVMYDVDFRTLIITRHKVTK